MEVIKAKTSTVYQDWELKTHSLKKLTNIGLPWWLSGKESACQCKGRGFNP